MCDDDKSRRQQGHNCCAYFASEVRKEGQHAALTKNSRRSSRLYVCAPTFQNPGNDATTKVRRARGSFGRLKTTYMYTKHNQVHYEPPKTCLDTMRNTYSTLKYSQRNTLKRPQSTLKGLHVQGAFRMKYASGREEPANPSSTGERVR